MEGKKCYPVNNLKMVNFLAKRDFEIVGVSDSRENPKLKVFFFEDSDRLRKKMKEFRKYNR